MAISEESYGRGQPVYSNGSYAPTKGTVDPQGYIDRSLNKPSQSRSGLAAAALSKLKGAVPQQQNIPGVLPIGDIKTLTITPTGQLVPDTEDTTQEPQPVLSGSGLEQMSPEIGPSALSPLAQAALSRVLANGGTPNGASIGT